APVSLAATPNAMALLLALRQRWALALMLGLPCATIAAVIAWFASPAPSFTVRAIVKIASTPQQILPGTPSRDGGHFSDLQKTQMSILKSRAVLKDVLNSPEVAELSIIANQADPLAWLVREIQADFTMGSEILSITMRGDKPVEIAVVVNAVT